MRVCRACQRVNGESDDTCRACGAAIAAQVCLHPSTPVPRPLPDVLARRNRGYLILLLLLPLAAWLNLAFWAHSVPDYLQRAEEARRQALAATQQQIAGAIAACERDTGAAPARLEVLRQPVVTMGDLLPGADPARWHGPYLSATVPFPDNPYRPGEGAAGWQYTITGRHGEVAPAPQP